MNTAPMVRCGDGAEQIVQAMKDGECAAEIHRLQDINGQLLDTVKFLVRWHGQLGPADIARAEAVIAKATGAAS